MDHESKGGMVKSGSDLRADSVLRVDCPRWEMRDRGQRLISK